MLLQTVGVEMDRMQHRSSMNDSTDKSAKALGLGSVESVNEGDLEPIEEVTESMVTPNRTQGGKLISSRQDSKG